MAKIEQATLGNSTSMSDFGYNVASRTLTIIFIKGGKYTYSSVPLTIYNGLLFASSKGTYFNLNIRGNYDFIKG